MPTNKEKLLKKIGQIETYTKTQKGNELYCKNRRTLTTLLYDHPYFQAKLSEFRKKHDLPNGGYESESEAFLWEHQESKLRQKLISDIDDLISGFNFNVLYRADIKTYAYELIICPKRAKRWSNDKVPAVVVFDADSDRNVNAEVVTPNGRYIQVFEWTTLKDIEDNWNEIKGGMDSKMQIGSINNLYRTIWLLKKAGKDQKEIQQVFRDSDEYKSLVSGEADGILDMSRISLYARRYEQQLMQLREFK